MKESESSYNPEAEATRADVLRSRPVDELIRVRGALLQRLAQDEIDIHMINELLEEKGIL